MRGKLEIRERQRKRESTAEILDWPDVRADLPLPEYARLSPTPPTQTAELFDTVQSLFAGRFELDRLVASSRIRALFLARDTYLEREVALRLHFAEDRQRTWFELETRLLAALDHPSIRTVFSAGEIEQWAFRTAKFIHGESLQEAVGRGPRTIPEVVRLARDLFSVLEYAHSQDIVLRRIVPANVMLERTGRAVITDLRFANRCLDYADPDPEGQEFLAPETWHGHVGEPASDMYAVAALLYFSVTGHPPATNPTEIVPPTRLRMACPQALERVLMRALLPDPHERYFSAAEMSDDLISELGDATVFESTPSSTRPSDDEEAYEKLLRRALGDEYELLEELGSGGFGNVYRVRDLRLERDVALKVLHPNLTSDPTVIERFRRESQLAARLEHPNIVDVYDVRSRLGVFWYTMAYVAGVNLARLVSVQGHLSLTRVTEIMAQVLDALEHAHARGVVHRDLKPENILIESTGGTVRITDFGLAIALQADRYGPGTSHSGTPEFAAPEQLLGERVDLRADLYSAACVAYFALTGQAPFGAGTPESIVARQAAGLHPAGRPRRPDVPDAVFKVLGKAMSRDPDDRYESATELAQALRAASNPNPWQRLRRVFARP